MIKTLIIGKNSNLSDKLLQTIGHSCSISSRELDRDIELLSEYKDTKINLIFNNFQSSTQLNNLQNSTQYISNAILITAKILDYFSDTDIEKIIYTSSSSVYGNNILCKESDEVKPMNLHASLKVSNEKLIQKYSTDNNIDYTIARIFNMYGGDDKFSVISKIINASKSNEELTIINNGNAIRDFIHIDDVVSAYSVLLDTKGTKIVNIGTGEGSSIKNILDFLTIHDIKLHIKNLSRDELKISTADNSLLKEITKKQDFIKVEEYLKKEFGI
jgi:UDP-glucose 4-epimerase